MKEILFLPIKMLASHPPNMGDVGLGVLTPRRCKTKLVVIATISTASLPAQLITIIIITTTTATTKSHPLRVGVVPSKEPPRRSFPLKQHPIVPF
jgi:hypothetical protein